MRAVPDTSIRKLLIANRGEIAVRIIRTAREMGIEAVLAVSEVDLNSMAARLADAVAVVGPAPAGKSYLNMEAIVAAAREHRCDAVHPGYGFLSEKAAFARSVVDAGLIWVGPSADAIELMGDKALARDAARRAGVPILAGTNGVLDGSLDEEAMLHVASEVGFPLVVKAAAGGGGRGIRLVREPGDFVGTARTARAEAKASFGDGSVYLERYVDHARHVEVQILGDGIDAIHLGDRDCSMQRRQQKILEEAPAPDLPDEVRARIRDSAVQLARDCGYAGAGTVEFLYDPVAEEASFIEMNTRLQVEHPVTEEVTGFDLVHEQLRIAGGDRLNLAQDQVSFHGHAIEVRVNAEDPTNNFRPSPGTIDSLDWGGGPGVRVDSGVADHGVVAPYYDSLLAKVITWDRTRDRCIARMSRALRETRVDGVATTIPLLEALVEREEFHRVTHHSKFIESTPIDLVPPTPAQREAVHSGDGTSSIEEAPKQNGERS